MDDPARARCRFYQIRFTTTFLVVMTGCHTSEISKSLPAKQQEGFVVILCYSKLSNACTMLQYVCTLILHYNIHLSVLPIVGHHINVLSTRVREEIIHNHDSSPPNIREIRGAAPSLHQFHCIENHETTVLGHFQPPKECSSCKDTITSARFISHLLIVG